jgi:hypothetical protein
VTVDSVTPAAQGWSGSQDGYPWLARLSLSGWSGGPTVVVKTQRPADHWRRSDTTVREQAALTFLGDRGCTVAPRLLAVDGQLGFVVLEDLGRGHSVEDALVGADPAVARRALLGHAYALAEMQAASVGGSEDFYARVNDPGIVSAHDRVSVQVMAFHRRWARLRKVVAACAFLPTPDRAEAEVADIIGWLDGAGPLLALSNGDFMPQNSRLCASAGYGSVGSGSVGSGSVGSGASVRLLDFEGATFQHALLDAAQLRIPYAAAPVWGTLPHDVATEAERVYRDRLGLTCPLVQDDAVFQTGMATAIAAWSVVRLTRLAEVDQRPTRTEAFGWRETGQLTHLLHAAVAAATSAGCLPNLRSWLGGVAYALERRWADLPQREPYYPAFRALDYSNR